MYSNIASWGRHSVLIAFQWRTPPLGATHAKFKERSGGLRMPGRPAPPKSAHVARNAVS